MADEGNQIKGKSLDKPLSFKGEEVKHNDYKISRSPYPLEKDEFYILTKSTSDIKDWQKRLFQISVGIFLTILSKLSYFLYMLITTTNVKEREKISVPTAGWEYISLTVALLAWIILLVVGRFKKSDKDKLISSIKTFFTEQ